MSELIGSVVYKVHEGSSPGSNIGGTRQSWMKRLQRESFDEYRDGLKEQTFGNSKREGVGDLRSLNEKAGGQVREKALCRESCEKRVRNTSGKAISSNADFSKRLLPEQLTSGKRVLLAKDSPSLYAEFYSGRIVGKLEGIRGNEVKAKYGTPAKGDAEPYKPMKLTVFRKSDGYVVWLRDFRVGADRLVGKLIRFVQDNIVRGNEISKIIFNGRQIK